MGTSMIHRLLKITSLLSFIITPISGEPLHEIRNSLKLRQLEEVTAQIPSLNTNDERSHIEWGSENGWDIWELRLLEFPTHLINALYSKDEYSKLSCNNLPSPYNSLPYFPNRLYKELHGKTIRSQYIESPKYVNGELDSYKYMMKDVVKITDNCAISSLNESFNGTAPVDSLEGRVQFNTNGEPLTLNVDANYLTDFTSISYQYEDDRITLCSGIYEESESSIYKVEYRMEYRSDGIISNMRTYSGIGSNSVSTTLDINDSTVYSFENGQLNEATSFSFHDHHIPSKLSRTAYEYYPSGLLKSKVNKHWNSLHQWGISSNSDSTKYSYNSSDCITLVELFTGEETGEETGEFIAKSKDSTRYNEDTKVIEEHSFIWSKSTAQWKPNPNHATSIYHYDNWGNLVSYQWNDEDPYRITYEDGYPTEVVQTLHDSIVAITHISVEDYSSPISENSAKFTNDSYIVTDFSLELSCEESSSVSNLKLFNLSGQVVAVVDSEKYGTNVSYNIGKSQIAAGIYVARFNIDGSPLSTKIQIQ